MGKFGARVAEVEEPPWGTKSILFEFEADEVAEPKALKSDELRRLTSRYGSDVASLGEVMDGLNRGHAKKNFCIGKIDKTAIQNIFKQCTGRQKFKLALSSGKYPSPFEHPNHPRVCAATSELRFCMLPDPGDGLQQVQ